MEDADGGATPSAAPDADDGRRSDDASEASIDVPQPEKCDESTTTEKVDALGSRWRTVATSPADVHPLRDLYRSTLRFVLQNEWQKSEEPTRERLLRPIEECRDALKNGSAEERRVRHLELVARDPWHHPVLKDIMRGGRPEPHKVQSWIREEGGEGAAERLKLLCATGGKLEGAALRLASALTPASPASPILPPHRHSFALDALLVLLLRARQTSECISRIKALEIREAVALIGRLAARNKSHGRIWKNAHDAAVLCAQVLVATYLVKPPEDNQLGVLASRLAQLYSDCPEELPPTFRKLLNSADTAAHIYIVCRAVQRQYESSMRPFVCELYVRALTTGVNELERQKHHDESVFSTSNTSHELADWFLSLADLLSPNPMVSAECVLTAFSLHPSKLYYRKVQEYYVNIQNSAKKTDNFESKFDRSSESLRIEESKSPNKCILENVDRLNCNLNKMDIASVNNSEALVMKSCISKRDKETEELPLSLISSAVLEGEGLELSGDLCRDLAVLLSGPRLKYLTWDLSWDKLSQYCLSYMADTEEGTKALTTELKYVHLDYSQFEIKPPEEHDIYFGIEKGYEHHLEVDEDWDEDDYIEDDTDYSIETKLNSNQNKDSKKSKNKSSGKPECYSDNYYRGPNDSQTSEKDIKTNLQKSHIQKSSSSTESCSENERFTSKVAPKTICQNNDNTYLKQYYGLNSCFSSNRSNLKIEQNIASSSDSLKNVSYYRHQMDLFEAKRKDADNTMVNHRNMLKNDNVFSQEDEKNHSPLNIRHNSSVYSSTFNISTYHKGHKENLNRVSVAKTNRDVECKFSLNSSQSLSNESNNNINSINQRTYSHPSNQNVTDKSRSRKSSLLLFRRQTTKRPEFINSTSVETQSSCGNPISSSHTSKVEYDPYSDFDWENSIQTKMIRIPDNLRPSKSHENTSSVYKTYSMKNYSKMTPSKNPKTSIVNNINLINPTLHTSSSNHPSAVVKSTNEEETRFSQCNSELKNMDHIEYYTLSTNNTDIPHMKECILKKLEKDFVTSKALLEPRSAVIHTNLYKNEAISTYLMNSNMPKDLLNRDHQQNCQNVIDDNNRTRINSNSCSSEEPKLNSVPLQDFRNIPKSSSHLQYSATGSNNDNIIIDDNSQSLSKLVNECNGYSGIGNVFDNISSMNQNFGETSLKRSSSIEDLKGGVENGFLHKILNENFDQLKYDTKFENIHIKDANCKTYSKPLKNVMHPNDNNYNKDNNINSNLISTNDNQKGETYQKLPIFQMKTDDHVVRNHDTFSNINSDTEQYDTNSLSELLSSVIDKDMFNSNEQNISIDSTVCTTANVEKSKNEENALNIGDFSHIGNSNINPNGLIENEVDNFDNTSNNFNITQDGLLTTYNECEINTNFNKIQVTSDSSKILRNALNKNLQVYDYKDFGDSNSARVNECVKSDDNTNIEKILQTFFISELEPSFNDSVSAFYSDSQKSTMDTSSISKNNALMKTTSGSPQNEKMVNSNNTQIQNDTISCTKNLLLVESNCQENEKNTLIVPPKTDIIKNNNCIEQELSTSLNVFLEKHVSNENCIVSETCQTKNDQISSDNNSLEMTTNVIKETLSLITSNSKKSIQFDDNINLTELNNEHITEIALEEKSNELTCHLPKNTTEKILSSQFRVHNFEKSSESKKYTRPATLKSRRVIRIPNMLRQTRTLNSRTTKQRLKHSISTTYKIDEIKMITNGTSLVNKSSDVNKNSRVVSKLSTDHTSKTVNHKHCISKYNNILKSNNEDSKFEMPSLCRKRSLLRTPDVLPFDSLDSASNSTAVDNDSIMKPMESTSNVNYMIKREKSYTAVDIDPELALQSFTVINPTVTTKSNAPKNTENQNSLSTSDPVKLVRNDDIYLVNELHGNESNNLKMEIDSDDDDDDTIIVDENIANSKNTNETPKIRSNFSLKKFNFYLPITNKKKKPNCFKEKYSILNDVIVLDELDDNEKEVSSNKNDSDNKSDIIVLSDDDNIKSDSSDVELVDSSDPIAIDIYPSPSKTQITSELSTETPAFITFVTDSISKKVPVKRKFKKTRMSRKNIQKNPESNMYIYGQNSEVIKVGKIPLADLKKLKIPCEVRIKPCDIAEFQKHEIKTANTPSQDKAIELKTITNSECIRQTNDDIKQPKFQMNMKIQSVLTTSNVKLLNNFDTCHKDSLYYKNEKNSNKDCIDNLDVSLSNEKTANQLDLELIERNSKNCFVNLRDCTKKFKKGNFQNEYEKRILSFKNNLNPDVLNNFNCMDDVKPNMRISNEIYSNINKYNFSKSENMITPDIIHQPPSQIRCQKDYKKCEVRCTPVTEINKNGKENSNDFEICNSLSLCPDLLSKTNNSYTATYQPDIVLSNNENKNNYRIERNNSNVTNKKVENTKMSNHNIDVDYKCNDKNESGVKSTKNLIKTYQNPSYKNKRKTEPIITECVKKLRNNKHIDLPRVSQKDIGSITHKSNIDNMKSYDRAFNLSIKELFLRESEECDVTDSDGQIKENLDVNTSDLNFLSKNLVTNDCPRNSFYSPIFGECEDEKCEAIEDYIKKRDEHEIIENNVIEDGKSLKRGKGFGVRSGRGNIKDPLRGRLEGPAAVLSDTITTRPPLALHNFSVNKKSADNKNTVLFEALKKTNSNDIVNNDFILSNPEKELNNNILHKILKNMKNNIKTQNYFTNENIYNIEKSTDFKDIFKHKENGINKNDKTFKFEHKLNNVFEKNVFSRIPGMADLDFVRPFPYNAVVQVVQLGQSPVNSNQQNSLTTITTPPQTTTNEYMDVSGNNSVEYRSPPDDESHQASSVENDLSDLKDTENAEKNQDIENNENSEENSINIVESQSRLNHVQTSNTDSSSTLSQIGNMNQITLEKSDTLDFSEQNSSGSNFTNNITEKDTTTLSDSPGENQTNNLPSTTASFISSNRGQTLVNLLSQKIIHSPVTGQHLQMTTIPKGTVNALSLQQALAQILPPPLSQASNDSVIQSASHSSGPQVVHIVQGKGNSQTSNSFGSLLVDSGQSTVMNSPGTTQVLHIVQGKPGTNTGSSTVLGQTQVSGATFSGLSIMDSNAQQVGNQVLHIVNTGVQNKNNTTQVLKRVNLLTNITNPQGNNEQKMVQFVCKSSDGKPIQLNAQHQRGMVLRLQPIDNSSFVPVKSAENQISNANVSTVQSGIKPQSDQTQELKSRSVYEENYAKFIQNSSQIMPSSPEKSTALPKFNQAFGKSVFQDNTAVNKSNDNIEQSQNPNVSVPNEQQNSQDLATTLNIGQLGHINSPPLLIRKSAQQNIVHQNVVQQVKQSVAPMNIQTIHGGVIYTRQIPVNTINLITVPSTDVIDEVQLQNIQKQSQEKNAVGDQPIESQVVKIVSQDQQSNASVMMDSSSDETNQAFTDQTQSHVNTHPLLTQMRIKVPMLSKGGGQMVTGARVVRPVLQIQRNLIPGTNPAVYQQLVLTTAPALRQPVPTPVTTIRPNRPSSTTSHQESNLSSSTLEQLREFDMVLEQVKERSTVQPGSSSNSTFSDSSPQRQVIENNTDLDSPQTNVSHPPQREVLYSIGPNQTVNVTYVNQKVISKTPSVLSTSYTSSDSNISTISSQNSPSSQVNHGLVNTIAHSKPCTSSSKVNSKTIKTKPKPTNPTNNNASKPNPVATKTSLQKPLEDEQTTQRILYILAEYKEQVENSPDKDKPAPRRRSNPPTNPTTSSKRKKSSGGSSKKSSSGQSLQEMSPIGGEDAGHTMGSEDSSCGLSQGECTDNSVQGPDNQSPQASPQKAAKKLLFQPEPDLSSTSQLQQSQTQQQPQRNVIIADGQTITMARPNTGKTTAVLMPANYILPMSMVKGGQQITIVTNQGPKILSVPHGEGNTTNALFLQRLISPAGLKPMLTRPGQVRHVRLPANTVQNLQTFNLSPNTTINSQDNSWINNNSINNVQPKLVVEYNANISNNSDINPDSVKSEISDTQSLKDDNISIGSEHISSVKLEDSSEPSSENRIEENIGISQAQTTIQDPNLSNISEHVLQQVHVPKSSGNTTLNLIQVHSLNSSDCGKLFSVQSSSGLNSLLQLSDKATLNQTLQNLNTENENSPSPIQDSSQNVIIGKQTHLENQFLSSNKADISHDGETDLKLSDINSIEDNLSMSDDLPNSVQQNFVLSQPNQSDKCHGASDNHSSWNTNGSVTRDNSSPFGYENSPHRLSNQEDPQDTDITETDEVRGLSENVTTRVLRHSYSPSSSPTGPRHLYHKMFISTPVKKTFGSEVVEHTVSSVDEDKQYVQVLDIRHPDGKPCSVENLDVTNVVQSSRNSLSQNPSSIHSAASLRHKYAVMEHELRLQKSLSEECEDLGVDSPSASDLFPEAELLFAASPSSQFDQSQDGCILSATNHSSPTTNINSSINHQIGSSSSLSTNISRESRMLTEQAMDVVEESEFARMHPNTTFHSGEIELVSDDADDASINISFRGTTDKQSLSQSHISSKRGEIVRSVIEGIGSSGGIASFSQSKLTSQFSMVDLSRRSRNPLSSLQSSDDYSEGAEDSMNSAESKEGIINKGLDGILSNEIVKRDLTLSSTESPICMASNIIQRNVTQVIRHASSDQLSLSGNDSDKLCNPNVTELSQNERNFLLENSSDARTTTDSGILKSIILERDGRDALTCSSPEQHSELFWESNSNSNQSEEHLPAASTNLLDFSSEDSNKCCKSPLSCEETNSTDSSSLGGNNSQSHNPHHPLRLNSVIKSSGGNSSAADGPILHSALISNNPNINQDTSKKMPLNLNNIHKSDSNTSSSPEDDSNRATNRRSWGRSIKNSGGRRVMSPRSLSVEINMGAEIETSSSEGISILTKSTSGIMMHSGSSTPEEGSGNSRRVSLRGPGGIKRPCHCCSGTPPTSTSSTNTSSTSRRARRRPPPLH